MFVRTLRDLFTGLRQGVGYTFSVRQDLTARVVGLSINHHKPLN